MILIVHSLDETTSFLSDIPNFLNEQGIKGVEYNIIRPATEDINKAIQRIIDCPDQGLIIFLGHGASHCIYTPANSNNEKSPLIGNSNFQLLRSKNFISLSCRSAEFIGRNYATGLDATMIGFDDLPTHWEDVLVQREVDINAYPAITDKVLEYFRSILVTVFKLALRDTLLTEERSFSFFYFRLRLYINKHIADILLKKISDNHSLLANILFELKQGIKLFGDKTSKLFN